MPKCVCFLVIRMAQGANKKKNGPRPQTNKNYKWTSLGNNPY